MSLRRLSTGRLYLSLLVIVLTCYAYFLPRWGDWNQNSRLDLVIALVDDHTFAIDKYVSNTGDYALYDGHHYSDKAPGMALLAVPVYAVVRTFVSDAVIDRLDSAAHTAGALRGTAKPDGSGLKLESMRFFVALVATAFVVGVLPAASLAVVFFWMLGRLGGGRREQLVGTLLYTLATPAFAYANSLVGHQTTAFLLFAAFALVFAIRDARIGRGWLVAVGFILGYALISEYPSALIAGVVGIYALATLPARVGAAVRLALGSVLPIAALAIHDVGAFGTPLPVGYFHSALWTDVHQTGFVSLTYPHMDALAGVTFGVYRGLFFLSPYLLLALFGYRRLWLRGWRAEVVVLSAAPLIYLLYNASSAMWSGGFGVGPRYMVASLPFVAVAASSGVSWAWRHRYMRMIMMLAIVWSFCAIWAETIGGQAFPDYTLNPLFDFSLPRLATGDIARNVGMILGLGGWSSVLPLVAIVAVALALIVVPLPFQSRTVPSTRHSVGSSTTWAS